MLKRGAIALSAAMVVSITGLAKAADEPAAPASTAAPEDEVVIEARKTTTQSINPKATSTQDIITTKQLSEIPVTTDFIQALQYLPNVDVYEEGGNGLNGSNITINGFDNSRINFTLDGIPLNDSDGYAFYSNEFLQNNDIASIIVDEGAGSASTLGITAFGGSIGITSKDPDPEHGAVIQGGAGSFGTFTEYVNAQSGEFLKDVAPTGIYMSYFHADSEGYFENSQTGYKNSILFKSDTDIGPGTLRLFFAQNDQLYNYYGGATAAQIQEYGDAYNSYTLNPASTSYTGYEYNQYRDWISYADYSLDVGRIKLDAKFFYYYGDGFGGGATTGRDLTGPDAEFNGDVLPEKSWNITNRPGAIVTATIPLIDQLSLKTGALYENSKEEHYEAEYAPVTYNSAGTTAVALGNFSEIARIYEEPVTTEIAYPYAELNYQPVSSLIIDAGAKYLTVHRDFADLPVTATETPQYLNSSPSKLLPSIGFNYEFTPGYHFYANYTENARTPTYDEFFEGTFNPDLQLEVAKTIQGGFLFRSGNLEGRLTGFDYRYENYVLEEETILPGTSTRASAYTNAGDATYYGGALAITYQILPWLSSFVNLGALHTHIDAYNGPAPFAPSNTEALGLQAQQGGWSASIAAHRRDVRDVDSITFSAGGGLYNVPSFYELPPITTVDAHIAYKWDKPFGPASFKTAEVKLTLTNITSQQKPIYEDDGYIYLSEPFSWFLTVQVGL
jgi:iron complex outermembrane recepter protein